VIEHLYLQSIHENERAAPSYRRCPCVYAGHVLVLGGESPLRKRKSEPLSEGKGVTARWGLEEAGATVTTRRTETG